MNPKKPRRLCECGCGREVKATQSIYYEYACQHRKQRDTFIARWKAGQETGVINNGLSSSHHIKNYLIEKLGEKCQRCGWQERHPTTNKVPIELEHIDGNGENNAEENLTLLCPNCHSLTPTYRGLNKGKGRKARR